MPEKNLVTTQSLHPAAADGEPAPPPDAPNAGAQAPAPAPEVRGAADARIVVRGGASAQAMLAKIKAEKKVPVWLREPVFVQIGGAGFTIYGAEDITEPVLVYEPLALAIANKRDQEKLANVRSKELRASGAPRGIAEVPERGF